MAYSRPAHDTLVLSAARRELSSARQSLLTIEPGEGWHARLHLAPEYWGGVTGLDIDRSLATERWLRSPEYDPRELRLVSLPLFGLTPVSDATWAIVNQPQTATKQEAREPVERGLLERSGQGRQRQALASGARAEQETFDGGHV